MTYFDDVEIISTYTQEQAIADGILVKICDIRWGKVAKPYLATANVLESVGTDGAMEIWKEFVAWKIHDMRHLPEEEQLFSTGVNEQTVWIIEDDSAFTLMHPEDY